MDIINGLIEGDIEKPGYLISKTNNEDLSQNDEFTLLKEEGGAGYTEECLEKRSKAILPNYIL